MDIAPRILILCMYSLFLSAWAPIPGGQDATEQAVDAAASEAVKELLDSVAADDWDALQTVYVVPLEGDSTGRATEEVVRLLQQDPRLRVVPRDDQTLARYLGEFEFTEAQFDVMPAEELSEFGRVTGADGVVYGRLRRSELDDTGVRARAEITLQLGGIETMMLAGAGRGQATVALDAGVVALGLLNRPWFVPLLAGVAVGVVALGLLWMVMLRPLRRRIAQATEPRRIVS